MRRFVYLTLVVVVCFCAWPVEAVEQILYIENPDSWSSGGMLLNSASSAVDGDWSTFTYQGASLNWGYIYENYSIKTLLLILYNTISILV